ncbi:MAG: glycosyltransferase [Chitinophagaceae bacterium]
MSNRKGVSVIICCYNSESRLPLTIEYLAKQAVSAELEWEIIIVDNNSTDSTASVAIQEWEKYNRINVSLKVILEPVSGLSSARKAGVNASSYEYIIFCDDDNWLQSDYVNNAFSFMENTDHAEIGIIGGKNLFVADVPKPTWFDRYSCCYAIGEPSDSTADITETVGMVCGAGMVIRKKIINEIYHRFNMQASDRKGDSLVAGGDWEICFLARFMRFRIWYYDALVLHHFMTPNRLTINYLKKLHYSFGLSDVFNWHYFIYKDNKSLHRVHVIHLIFSQIRPLISSYLQMVFSKDKLGYTLLNLIARGKILGLIKNGHIVNDNYKQLQKEFGER